MPRDQVDYVTGWLCFSCGHTSPGGDDPEPCCANRVALRVGFRHPDVTPQPAEREERQA